jgi:RNA polymerase sigma factor (sigma-70 family)
MRDGDLVVAVVAGDPGALAAVYDEFAPALYGYCRSLLSEPADAAGSVRDTFVVARVKLPLLPDPGRLRPWVYAVARNECRRRRRGEGAPVSLTRDEFGAGEVTADLGLGLEQGRQREMLSSALAGLNPRDREIVELSLRHEFSGADLADVLGVPRTQARALTTRARSRFEAALGGLMVARSEVSPPDLLAVLPGPVLPDGLRHETLSLLADVSPDAVQERAEIAERAGPFGRSGFPVPLDPLAARRRLAFSLPAAGVLVSVVAMFGGGAMLVAGTMHHASPPASPAVASAVPSAQAPPAASTPTGPRSGRQPSNGQPGAGGGATGSPSSTARAAKSAASSRPGSRPSSARPPTSTQTPAPPATSPAPSPTSSAPSPSPSPTDTSPSPPPPASGGHAGGILGTIIGWL